MHSVLIAHIRTAVLSITTYSPRSDQYPLTCSHLRLHSTIAPVNLLLGRSLTLYWSQTLRAPRHTHRISRSILFLPSLGCDCCCFNTDLILGPFSRMALFIKLILQLPILHRIRKSRNNIMQRFKMSQ